MCCWRSPGCWTLVWTWSLCLYVWDCVSRASTQKLCLQSLKNCVKLLNPSRLPKTAPTEVAPWSTQMGNFDGIMPHCWICTYHGLANQICLSVGTLSPHFVTNCSCFLLLLVSQFFFFLKVWTSSPLPKQYSSPYISVSSYILPQIWVCSKSLLLFVKCKLRVALALTSCLNLKAYLSFLSVNLCCTFHKKMVFLCELYIISYELFLFYNLILLSFPLSM